MVLDFTLIRLKGEIALKTYDYLIIGTGASGLTLALHLANLGQVALITKASVPKSNSSMAQGGIATVLSKTDSFDEHIKDTLIAGDGLCSPEAVKEIISKGPAVIENLLNKGLAFDASDSSYTKEKNKIHLTKEGGHSHRRIIHIKDQTGLHLNSFLFSKVKEQKNITLFENHFALDLITNHQLAPIHPAPAQCLGALVYNSNKNKIEPFYAAYTILATGGAGKVFRYTSNWDGATGDGIAMAYRAGARPANLEFTQFHPTCLFHPKAKNFLISEALRGEGAILINKQGEDFTKKSHPKGSLAPRDIVARAIDEEMKHSGAECVYLDITHKSSDFIKNHFPNIQSRCAELGIDITKEPIPVVPAAHYQCGGILSSINGQTDIDNLFAIGECSFNGFHGANRLASNSLLECLVTSQLCANSIKKRKDNETAFSPKFNKQFEAHWQNLNKRPLTGEEEKTLISHLWSEIRTLMWNYVGIVRSDKRLFRAYTRLSYIRQEIEEYYLRFNINQDLLELRNLSLVAHLIVRCAQNRKESRGIHFNTNYPSKNENALNTILSSSTKSDSYSTELIQGPPNLMTEV